MESPDTSKHWYEEIAEAAENCTPPAELGNFATVEAYPEWVVNVAKELFQQATPSFHLRRLKKTTPETLGLWFGQNCANLSVIGELLDLPAEKLDEGKETASKIIETLKNNQSIPGAKNYLNTITIAGHLLEWLASELPKFEELLHRAFKQALDQPYAEATAFFQGFAQGLSKKGVVANELARTTTATPIYKVMYFNWPEVDKLTSVTSLWHYLKKQGVTKQQLGDNERLSKLCFRIKYRPGKRGRPLSTGK